MKDYGCFNLMSDDEYSSYERKLRDEATRKFEERKKKMRRSMILP